jgi:hypothetical protein
MGCLGVCWAKASDRYAFDPHIRSINLFIALWKESWTASMDHRRIAADRRSGGGVLTAASERLTAECLMSFNPMTHSRFLDDYIKYAGWPGWLNSEYIFARAWFEGNVVSIPAELSALLETHADTRSIELEVGEPEARIRFDDRKGEVRNADMAIRVRVDGQPFAITIEAKAGEAFDRLLPKTLLDSLERFLQSGRGSGIERVRDLAASLLPPMKKGFPGLDSIRYQLLTAVAGTLAWAR